MHQPTEAIEFPAAPTSADSQAHLPEITAREVSWHATTAAIRARHAAEAQGIDPAAKLALIHGTTESRLHPRVTLGCLWAIEATEPHVTALTRDHKLGDQALICHTLLHPEEALLAILAGDLESLAAGILLTAASLPITEAYAIETHFHNELARLKHLTGGASPEPAKKPLAPPPSGPFNAGPPAPAPAGSSPS